MIARFERFLFQISEIVRLWHKIAKDEMEPYGLSGTAVVYFTALSAHPEGMTAVQLSESCCRDKADVSRAMAVLEKKGLVARQGANGYRTLLRLTEQGRVLAEEIDQKVMTAVELTGRGLTEEDRRTFYAALDLIVSNLQKLEESGLPK